VFGTSARLTAARAAPVNNCLRESGRWSSSPRIGLPVRGLLFWAGSDAWTMVDALGNDRLIELKDSYQDVIARVRQ
jgi:hypothetical protein